MAQSLCILSFKLALLSLLVAVANSHSHTHKNRKRMKETNMVMYLQDWIAGPNATGATVAGLGGRNSGVLSFGSITVIDHALTEGVDRQSKQVGRAQGMYVGVELSGNNLVFLFSILFTDGPYNGSTLEVQGLNVFLLRRRELSVVSGTGAFRFAKGHLLSERAFFDPINFNAVLSFNVTVRYPVRSL